MLEIGQKVRVMDQKPTVIGTIIEVSTWGKVLSLPIGEEVCYLVSCPEWHYPTRWFNEPQIEVIEGEGTE